MPDDGQPREALQTSALMQCEARLMADPADPSGNFLMGALAEEVGSGVLAHHYWRAAGRDGVSEDLRRAACAAILDTPLEATQQTDLHRREVHPHVRGAMAFFEGRFGVAVELLHEAARRDPSPTAALHLARAMIVAKCEAGPILAVLEPAARYAGVRQAEAQIEYAGVLFRANQPISISLHENELRAHEPLVAEIRRARDERLIVRVSDNYLDKHHVRNEWFRSQVLLEYKRPVDSVVNSFHRAYYDAATALLQAGGVSHLVNFGVLCGATEFALAAAHPDVAIMGVDRDEEVRDLNAERYRRPNLSFHAADIGAFIDALPSPRSTVLAHIKTGELLYPQMLVNLYKRCANAGIRCIMLAEDWAISRETQAFSPAPFASAAMVGSGFLHDYAGFLQDAGYTVPLPRITPLPMLWKHPLMVDTHIYAIEATAEDR